MSAGGAAEGWIRRSGNIRLASYPNDMIPVIGPVMGSALPLITGPDYRHGVMMFFFHEIKLTRILQPGKYTP
jgi:hypothetical protein